MWLWLGIAALGYFLTRSMSASAAESVLPMPDAKPMTRTPRAPAFQPDKADSQAAAVELRSYLAANPGAKLSTDLNVLTLQTRMGGIVADGRWGQKTQARARQLGVVIP